MAITKTKTVLMSGLIAAIMASAGGAQFLKHHHNPTLREVLKSCEAGELSGIICCEDVNKVTDNAHFLDQCGMVKKGSHDPFGVRTKEEDDWDAEQEKQAELLK